MELIEALRTRRSVRAYSQRAVAREVIEELIDCARLAPSEGNQQPWEFVVITDEARRHELATLCRYGAPLAEAPVVVLIASRETDCFREDCACAALTLMTAARAYELGSLWIQTLDRDHETEIRELAGLPETLRAVCLIGIGHGIAPPPPPKRPRSEVLHWEQYAAGVE